MMTKLVDILALLFVYIQVLPQRRAIFIKKKEENSRLAENLLKIEGV